MSRLRVIDGYQPFGSEPPLVVAVSSSSRFGTVEGAVIRSLAETAAGLDLATVIPLDTLPWLPHFDVSAGCSVVSPRLAQTGALLEQADAVLFCVTEYAEGLPAIVGNLLEWAIAGGFLAGKRVGWINVANGTTRARAAHDILERTLKFAGADILLRSDVPLASAQVSPAGRLADTTSVDAVIAALRQLLPANPLSADLSRPSERTPPVYESSTDPDAQRARTQSETCVAVYAAAADPVDRVARDSLWVRHLAYLDQLHQAGRVLLAGPFDQAVDDLEGFAVFASCNQQEVERLVAVDPAVGPLLRATVRGWDPLFGAERLPSPADAGQAQVEQTIHRLFVEGVTARNPEAYFDRSYHPAVIIHEAPSLPYGGEYRGLDGAAEHALAFTRAWNGLQSAELRDMSPRIVATDSEAFVVWTLRGQRPSDPGVTEFPAISHYRFRDGRVIESRMFLFDTAAVAAFLDDGEDR